MKDIKIRNRVAAIIIENDKLLLIAHKKDGQAYWLVPGGGVEYGESLDTALKREIKEELGISIEVNDIAIVCDSIDPNGSRHIINIYFNCRYLAGNLSLGNDKRLFDYKFFNQNELNNLQIFPPIQSELNIVMNSKNSCIYLGERWEVQ